MNRFIDWIWHIKGSLALAPGQTPDEALRRLDPLFNAVGTHREVGGDRLVFSKKDPAAQDKMSVFDEGVLQIHRGSGGNVLRYRLTSRALLYCFLAPLLFLALAQLNVALGRLERPVAEAGAAEAAKKASTIALHPIDKFLGAPEPDRKAGGEKKRDRHSPTPGYVFAGIFVALYVAGRVLEDRLVRSLFQKRLMAA